MERLVKYIVLKKTKQTTSRFLNLKKHKGSSWLNYSASKLFSIKIIFRTKLFLLNKFLLFYKRLAIKNRENGVFKKNYNYAF